jgi:RHS repeat-associated protein
VVERFVYEPYGQAAAWNPTWSSSIVDAYGWVYLHQGGRYDAASGLYNFRNRDYSPTLGRWLQLDPLGFSAGDDNLYRYENDQVILMLDPTGLWAKLDKKTWDDTIVPESFKKPAGRARLEPDNLFEKFVGRALETAGFEYQPGLKVNVAPKAPPGGKETGGAQPDAVKGEDPLMIAEIKDRTELGGAQYKQLDAYVTYLNGALGQKGYGILLLVTPDPSPLNQDTKYATEAGKNGWHIFFFTATTEYEKKENCYYIRVNNLKNLTVLAKTEIKNGRTNQVIPPNQVESPIPPDKATPENGIPVRQGPQQR